MQSKNMTLFELLSETEALTYINALKVTITEIKEEMSQQEQLTEYLTNSRDRTRKLIRKVDSQYRLISKLINREPPVANNVTVEDDIDSFDEMKELMSDV